MKPLIIIILFFIEVLNINCQETSNLYGIKSGIIEYKHSGTSVGASTLYFDNFGHKSANYSEITYNGSTTPKKGWIISFNKI